MNHPQLYFIFAVGFLFGFMTAIVLVVIANGYVIRRNTRVR